MSFLFDLIFTRKIPMGILKKFGKIMKFMEYYIMVYDLKIKSFRKF